MSYYFCIVGTKDNPLFELEFGTSKQGGDGVARFSQEARRLNPFIVHSSLDIVDEMQFLNNQMCVLITSIPSKKSHCLFPHLTPIFPPRMKKVIKIIQALTAAQVPQTYRPLRLIPHLRLPDSYLQQISSPPPAPPPQYSPRLPPNPHLLLTFWPLYLPSPFHYLPQRHRLLLFSFSWQHDNGEHQHSQQPDQPANRRSYSAVFRRGV